MEDTAYTEWKAIECLPGCWVEVNKALSGIAAARLAAKKSVLFSLYRKSKIIDSENDELNSDTIVEAERISVEHDIAKILFGIKSWIMTPQAFVSEVAEMDTPNSTAIEQMNNEILAEINTIIDKVWADNSLTKKSDDAKKNLTESLISSSTEASAVSVLTKRNLRKSTQNLTKQLLS